ncbi:hypothetical protein TNCT_726771 [Trichonephila clavata]|uniref:Uncharacterized protein n=1 Tax=Trichonephila clavata TaxID=2740835 RepID=A0A8X6LNH9_TRICU|nr:hypothetical protein TNCT_726771 [Trichonephila clavata]
MTIVPVFNGFLRQLSTNHWFSRPQSNLVNPSCSSRTDNSSPCANLRSKTKSRVVVSWFLRADSGKERFLDAVVALGRL